MSRQTLASIGILLAVFVAGIVLGFFIASGDKIADASAKKTAGASFNYSSDEAATRVEANTVLSHRILELEKELAAQKKDDRVVLADRLAFYKKYSQALYLSPFDDHMKVTPIMAEFLKLTPQEEQALDLHLAQIQAELKKVEKEKIVIAKQDSSGVTYQIPAFSEGKAIRDELNSLVADDIGQDRADVFLGSAKGQLIDQNFLGFGEGSMEIQISPTKENANLAYMMKETFANGSSEMRPIREVPPPYQGLIELTPAP